MVRMGKIIALVLLTLVIPIYSTSSIDLNLSANEIKLLVNEEKPSIELNQMDENPGTYFQSVFHVF